MMQRDYILRMIEEAAQMVARLMGLRKQKQYDEALQQIEDNYRAFFKLDRQTLHLTEDNQLPDLLVNEYELPEEMLGILADFLREEGEILYHQAKWEESSRAFHKALYLLEYLNETNKEVYDFSRIHKMDGILAKLTEMI
ncbi:MAG: hypothetical protein AAF206_19365 [Bacteroidota bacterium]